MDVLSAAIAVMRTGQPYSNRLQLGEQWCYRFDRYDGIGFHVLLSGTAWLIPEQGPSIRLDAGDVLLMPHGSPHHLSDSPQVMAAVPVEDATAGDGPADFLCGKYRLDRSRVHPLLAGLPDVIHLSGGVGAHPELDAAITLLAAEVDATRQGQSAALTALVDVLLVYLVRAWLDENPITGWPKAIHDP
ncbi:MAG: cupin domain-containing protein, partial [Mycobacterium sp.]